MGKRSEVIQAIIRELNRLCQCNFEGSRIINAGFKCFPSSPNAVTFRAIIYDTKKPTASELIEYLEDWITSGTFISVQAQLLSTDDSCAVYISSFGEPECNVQGTTSTKPPELTVASDAAISSVTTTLFGVMVAVVVIIMVVITTTVLLKCRKKATLNRQADAPQM